MDAAQVHHQVAIDEDKQVVRGRHLQLQVLAGERHQAATLQRELAVVGAVAAVSRWRVAQQLAILQQHPMHVSVCPLDPFKSLGHWHTACCPPDDVQAVCPIAYDS